MEKQEEFKIKNNFIEVSNNLLEKALESHALCKKLMNDGNPLLSNEQGKITDAYLYASKLILTSLTQE